MTPFDDLVKSFLADHIVVRCSSLGLAPQKKAIVSELSKWTIWDEAASTTICRLAIDSVDIIFRDPVMMGTMFSANDRTIDIVPLMNMVACGIETLYTGKRNHIKLVEDARVVSEVLVHTLGIALACETEKTHIRLLWDKSHFTPHGDIFPGAYYWREMQATAFAQAIYSLVSEPEEGGKMAYYTRIIRVAATIYSVGSNAWDLTHVFNYMQFNNRVGSVWARYRAMAQYIMQHLVETATVHE